MDWSPLFAIGLTLRGPRNGLWGFFHLGFLMSSGFLGIFWLNLTKSRFLRHCILSPHFITSLLTTVNLMAQTAVVIFILPFNYFAQLPHFHCGTEIQLIRND